MNARAEFLPGLFTDMPFEAYHAVEALSASGAKKILQSPLHYKLNREKPSTPTDAMRFGTVVHDGVLEPQHFNDRVLSLPHDAPSRPTSRQVTAKKPSLGTIEAIAYWEDFEKRANGRIVLQADEYARALRCIAAVRAHPAASHLLEGAVTEVSLFWNDARYDVPCKARWDVFNHGGVIDVKTTVDASPEGFARQIVRLLYHVQGAHYVSAGEHVRHESPRFFAFIAVESEEPHAVACYALPGDAIIAGSFLMNKALGRYADALRTGTFSGYADTIEEIRLPRYALRFDV